jgi:hypothetical protein
MNKAISSFTSNPFRPNVHGTMAEAQLTPMMAQYRRIKSELPMNLRRNAGFSRQ